MNDVPGPIDRRRAMIVLVMVNALWGISFPIMRCLNLLMDQHFGITEASMTTSYRGRVGGLDDRDPFRFGMVVFGLVHEQDFQASSHAASAGRFRDRGGVLSGADVASDRACDDSSFPQRILDKFDSGLHADDRHDQPRQNNPAL